MKKNNNMTQSERCELFGVLIDTVEDWLEMKGITTENIPNDEREDEESAIIYGSDYDYLADRFSEILGIDRDVSEESKTDVKKKRFTTEEEITEYFIKDGWTENTSFTEITVEEATAEGLLCALTGIKEGRKYFRMNICGNIYDDNGKLIMFNLK